MISSLVSWIAGLFLQWSSNGILGQIVSGLTAAGDMQTKVALAQIEAEVQARQVARDIRNATSGFWEMRLISFLIAFCFTLHLVAVSLDTVFKMGWAVSKFPTPFSEWEGAILLSFFGVQGGIVAVRSIAAAILTRASR
jgi:hypothetical protein